MQRLQLGLQHFRVNQANIAAMNAETDVQLKDLLRNRIVDYYLTVDTPDKAVSQLLLWNTANSKRTLVPVYLRMRQWANAQTALNAIGTGNAEDAAFTSVYQTLVDIGNAGGNILTFTPAQKGSLDLVAKGTTSMRHTAQGLLNAADRHPHYLGMGGAYGWLGKQYCEEPRVPDVRRSGRHAEPLR